MLYDWQLTFLSIFHCFPLMVIFLPFPYIRACCTVWLIALFHASLVTLWISSLGLCHCCPYDMASYVWLPWKAVRGGLGKTSAKWQSFATIDRQCLAIRFGIEGSLGSYAEAKTGLLFSFFLATFLRSVSLGTFLALVMADSTISCWYPLSRRRSFNSSSLLSLSSGSEQTLIILMASPLGRAKIVCLGWQLSGRRYWFLSVGFLYKSVCIFQSLILQSVS